MNIFVTSTGFLVVGVKLGLVGVCSFVREDELILFTALYFCFVYFVL